MSMRTLMAVAVTGLALLLVVVRKPRAYPPKPIPAGPDALEEELVVRPPIPETESHGTPSKLSEGTADRAESAVVLAGSDWQHMGDPAPCIFDTKYLPPRKAASAKEYADVFIKVDEGRVGKFRFVKSEPDETDQFVLPNSKERQQLIIDYGLAEAESWDLRADYVEAEIRAGCVIGPFETRQEARQYRTEQYPDLWRVGIEIYCVDFNPLWESDFYKDIKAERSRLKEALKVSAVSAHFFEQP